MEEIREYKRIDATDIREFCVENDYYTHGDNKDYEHMLTRYQGTDISAEELYEIASDIVAHSDEYFFEGDPIIEVMNGLALITKTFYEKEGNGLSRCMESLKQESVADGDYVMSPCKNMFNGNTSFWLTKKGMTVAMYCFSYGPGNTGYPPEKQDIGQYIKIFQERFEEEKPEMRAEPENPIPDVKKLHEEQCLDQGRSLRTIYIVERNNPKTMETPQVYLDGKEAVKDVRKEYETQLEKLGIKKDDPDNGYGVAWYEWNIDEAVSCGNCLIDSDTGCDRWYWRITKHEIAGPEGKKPKSSTAPANPASATEKLHAEAYRQYYINWMADHEIGLTDINRIVVRYLEDNRNEEVPVPFAKYLEEHGFGGELFACFDEFMENEYLDQTLMLRILPWECHAGYWEDVKNILAKHGKTA